MKTNTPASTAAFVATTALVANCVIHLVGAQTQNHHLRANANAPPKEQQQQQQQRALQDAASNELFSDWTSGKATYYGGAVTGGACGYNSLPTVSFPSGYSVATGGDAFDDGYGCGACFEVTCTGAHGNNPDCVCGGGQDKKVIVQATDRCPGCETNHLDLNPAAFGSVVGSDDAGMAATCGVIETKIKRVSCDFKGSIRIRSKSGTSGWWYGLHVDDVAGYGAVSSVKLREAGRRDDDDDFDVVCDKSGGPSYWRCNIPRSQMFPPLDVSITDSAGRELRRNNVIDNLDGDLTFDFGTNFGEIDDGGDEGDSDGDGDDNSSPLCKDDPSFKYQGKQKRGCEWVGAKRKKRCKKRWEGEKLRNYCPEACRKC